MRVWLLPLSRQFKGKSPYKYNAFSIHYTISLNDESGEILALLGLQVNLFVLIIILMCIQYLVWVVPDMIFGIWVGNPAIYKYVLPHMTFSFYE